MRDASNTNGSYEMSEGQGRRKAETYDGGTKQKCGFGFGFRVGSCLGMRD
jgi:hypothetical protein